VKFFSNSSAAPAKIKFIGFAGPFLFPCLLILATLPLVAQTTSEIGGTVKDQQGLAIAGAEIVVRNEATGAEARLTADREGHYRAVGLSAGRYTITVTHRGFATEVYMDLVVTVNRVLQLDIKLKVGSVEQRITVGAAPPLLETGTSSSGSTVVPVQVESMPINGRNYLDLLQLVPGAAINRNAGEGDDNSAPILGERANNAVILIDGLPNRDEVNGGPAGQFDQDSVLEFQVLTSGYKAEFGHGSGGVLNVVTKSGTNQWHGTAALFHRNYLLDTSDISLSATPFLLRWDASTTLGGPILRDRLFFFGSAERIRESRQANFQFPADFPNSLRPLEESIDKHNQTYESRVFTKLDEPWRHHRFTEEMNLVNAHIADDGDIPSTRRNHDFRRLMLGFRDTALLGDQGNPYILNAYLQYRGEPTVTRPAHLEEGLASTFVNLFSSLDTGGFFGDVSQELVGPGFTPLLLDQKYLSTGANLARQFGRHGLKFGWDLQRLHVKGTEAVNIFDALFATVSDFEHFGLENSGVHGLFVTGGTTPDQNRIRLRNTYNGLFAQDDWKAHKDLILNLGLRWDYDSEFPNRANVSPRLGVAWSLNSRTVLSAAWGVFYDHFRAGLARDIPRFGGAEITSSQSISFPRLFYGNPSIGAILGGLCLSTNMTDAQIASSGATCPFGDQPFFGIDHLNGVVAPGHAPIPANSVVTINNVQSLTGLTQQQFAETASAAVGEAPGLFSWNSSGNLSVGFLGVPTSRIPITVAPGFHTPHTLTAHVGIQRQLTADFAAYADFFHKDIRDILGVRVANLAFEARLPGNAGETLPGSGALFINSYGPWFGGIYDGVTIGVRKQASARFLFEANYTYTHETDNLLNSRFQSDVQTGLGARLTAFGGPTDSFIGIPPVVTDPVTGQTNAHGSFIASNGNPVPQASKFSYGPNLDRGPSDLALTHTFLAHGLVQLPWQFEISGIFRAQSGFPYSRTFSTNPPDVDGDGIPNFIDFRTGRNHFNAPWYANTDLRFSKQFKVSERVKLLVLVEFFNLFNSGNPSVVQQSVGLSPAFGTVTQVLPGREGQVALKVQF
jgi:hypothetical protein